jgi:hypothetical protein
MLVSNSQWFVDLPDQKWDYLQLCGVFHQFRPAGIVVFPSKNTHSSIGPCFRSVYFGFPLWFRINVTQVLLNYEMDEVFYSRV